MIARFSPYFIQKQQNDFYYKKSQLMLKDTLKVFNNTKLRSRYKILATVSRTFTKKQLRNVGFNFSNTMYKTSKRKLQLDLIDEREVVMPLCKRKKSEDVKRLIVNELNANSEISSKISKGLPVYYLNDSKLAIFKKIKTKNPSVSLSQATYYKLIPRNYQYATKKTDMCDICISGKKALKRNRDEDEEMIAFYNSHKKIKEDQKSLYDKKVSSLENGECIIIVDFKENFKIGGSRIETSQSFYNKIQVTCLGFCMVYKDEDIIKRKYHTFLSSILTHDSFMVINCIEILLKTSLARFKKLHFWSDNAMVFRSGEYQNYILRKVKSNKLTTLNYFVEYHGKSNVDSHFGVLQKAFDFEEKNSTIRDLFDLFIFFIQYFVDKNTDADFDIYYEPTRNTIVEKVKIDNSKSYLSFKVEKNLIYGHPLSVFEQKKYYLVDYKVFEQKTNRRSKVAPKKAQLMDWAPSNSILKTMQKRIALNT